MMAMLELLLIIFNIIVLSTLYATIVFLLTLFLSKTTNIRWTKKVLAKKLRFWLLTHFIISVLLVIFSFSYWQDTGIGDNSKIPVGYGQTIQSEDFVWTYFYPDLNKTSPNKDELKIENYKITDNILCAKISHFESVSPPYDFIVYNLKNKTYQTFANEQEYSNYATRHSLPLTESFYDFRTHYHEYLDNLPFWRKWLFP